MTSSHLSLEKQCPYWSNEVPSVPACVRVRGLEISSDDLCVGAQMICVRARDDLCGGSDDLCEGSDDLCGARDDGLRACVLHAN